MNEEVVTWDSATKAIEKARHVYAHVRTAIGRDGATHHVSQLLISKEQALSAIKEISGTDYIPNVVVSEGGAKVVIGQHATAEAMPSLGHDESNNGNF